MLVRVISIREGLVVFKEILRSRSKCTRCVTTILWILDGRNVDVVM